MERGKPFEFLLNGKPIKAYHGETIAAALFASDERCMHKTTKNNSPRGYYCGMGVCWECVMVVDGKPNVRTCVTFARPGMRVETQYGLGPREER